MWCGAVRRWQDIKKFGSVNQDPIFKNNSVPNPEMCAPLPPRCCPPRPDILIDFSRLHPGHPAVSSCASAVVSRRRMMRSSLGVFGIAGVTLEASLTRLVGSPHAGM